MIEVMNLRNVKPSEPFDKFIDRRCPIGNPFPLNNEKDRDEVCDKYLVWFKEQLKTNESFNNYLNELIETYKKYGRLRLFCWCYPKRCHGNTIKSYIIHIGMKRRK